MLMSNHHPTINPWLGATGHIIKVCLIIGVGCLGVKAIDLSLDIHDKLFFMNHQTLAYLLAFVSAYVILVLWIGLSIWIWFLGHNDDDLDLED